MSTDVCRWAFSIWGIIFGLQGVGVIYQLLPKGYSQEGKKRIVNSVGANCFQYALPQLHDWCYSCAYCSVSGSACSFSDILSCM